MRRWVLATYRVQRLQNRRHFGTGPSWSPGWAVLHTRAIQTVSEQLSLADRIVANYQALGGIKEDMVLTEEQQRVLDAMETKLLEQVQESPAAVTPKQIVDILHYNSVLRRFDRPLCTALKQIVIENDELRWKLGSREIESLLKAHAFETLSPVYFHKLCMAQLKNVPSTEPDTLASMLETLSFSDVANYHLVNAIISEIKGREFWTETQATSLLCSLGRLVYKGAGESVVPRLLSFLKSVDGVPSENVAFLLHYLVKLRVKDERIATLLGPTVVKRVLQLPADPYVGMTMEAYHFFGSQPSVQRAIRNKTLKSVGQFSYFMLKAIEKACQTDPITSELLTAVKAAQSQRRPTDVDLVRVLSDLPLSRAELTTIVSEFTSLKESNPKNVMTLLILLERHGCKDFRIIQHAVTLLRPNWHEIRSRDLGLLVRAIGMYHFYDVDLWAKLTLLIQNPAVLAACDAQALANVYYGISFHPLRHVKAWLPHLAAESKKRIDEFTTQGLANIILALGRLDSFDEPLFEAVSAGLLQQVEKILGIQVGYVLYYCWKLQYRHDKLISSLVEHHYRKLNGGGIVSGILALRILDVPKPQLESLLLDALIETRPPLAPHEMGMIASNYPPVFTEPRLVAYFTDQVLLSIDELAQSTSFHTLISQYAKANYVGAPLPQLLLKLFEKSTNTNPQECKSSLKEVDKSLVISLIPEIMKTPDLYDISLYCAVAPLDEIEPSVLEQLLFSASGSLNGGIAVSLLYLIGKKNPNAKSLARVFDHLAQVDIGVEHLPRLCSVLPSLPSVPPSLLKSLEATVLAKGAQLTPGEVCMVLGGLAKLGVYNWSLVAQLSRVVEKATTAELEELTAAQLAEFYFGIGKVGGGLRPVLGSAYESLSQRARCVVWTQVQSILVFNSLRRCGIEDAPLLQHLEQFV